MTLSIVLPKRFLKISALAIFSLMMFGASAQYSLGVSAHFINAFDGKTKVVGGIEANPKMTYGYQGAIDNSFKFDSIPFEVVARVGAKQLFFSGDYDELSYTGNSIRVIVSAGGRYLFTDKVKAGVFFELENNLDETRLRAGAGDMFRYALSFEGAYKLAKRWEASFVYSRALSPIIDQYILFNPINQLRFGINFKIL